MQVVVTLHTAPGWHMTSGGRNQCFSYNMAEALPNFVRDAILSQEIKDCPTPATLVHRLDYVNFEDVAMMIVVSITGMNLSVQKRRAIEKAIDWHISNAVTRLSKEHLYGKAPRVVYRFDSHMQAIHGL